MTTITTDSTLDRHEYVEFLNAYIECLLWQATVTDEDGNTLCLDETDYDMEHLSEDALKQIKEDCAAFASSHADQIRLANYGSRGEQWTNFALAGHDFCLTRNGHGAGFWDRGLGELGEELTAASKPYGSVDLYISDADTLEVM